MQSMNKTNKTNPFTTTFISKAHFLFIILIFASIGSAWAQGNNLIDVSGKVMDKETGKPLSGVSIQIKGSLAGTITSDSGKFTIRTKSVSAHPRFYFRRFCPPGI